MKVFDRIRKELNNRMEIRERIADLRCRERLTTQAISRLLETKPEGFVKRVKLLVMDREDMQEERYDLQDDIKQRSWWKVIFNR